jgi:hypothetical protein
VRRDAVAHLGWAQRENYRKVRERRAQAKVLDYSA